MDLTFQIPMLFTVLDLASITSPVHIWALFLLWLHPFILSGVISPLISREFIFHCMDHNKLRTGSKLGKEYIKAVYCHLAYLTYIESMQKAQGPGVCKLPKPRASRALCQ